MTDIVIVADQISKSYLVGHQKDSYATLRDVASREVRSFLRKGADFVRGRQIVQGDEVEEFWALKDVTFQIGRGDVIGIIGRNGAGKSTLLKILSRITEPSKGRLIIRGRVASLLEVGTGFHPELTGRENIYLNGAILGMSRREIERKFDEIVDFSDIERFLDTPVKRYSSGMYVRLAFAVAAHLEPEILVIDEVLSVGDVEFQKKCLGKMSEVALGGRTVLFVSHNMAAVRKLCKSAMLIDSGTIKYLGNVQDAISQYMHLDTTSLSSRIELASRDRRGTGEVKIDAIFFPNWSGLLQYRIYENMNVAFQLSALSPEYMKSASIWVLFRNANGDDILMLMQKDSDAELPYAISANAQLSTLTLLTPGRYSICCGVLGKRGEILDWVDDAFTIEVEPMFESGKNFDSRLGLVTAKAEWSFLDGAPWA
jgi:lipopolysaccharide transport system ATP-binding protein